MKKMSELFNFQDFGAPAREAISLLTQETPEYIELNLWPQINLDFNPVDYGIWSGMQENMKQNKQHGWAENRIQQAWCELGVFFDRVIKICKKNYWLMWDTVCTQWLKTYTLGQAIYILRTKICSLDQKPPRIRGLVCMVRSTLGWNVINLA